MIGPVFKIVGTSKNRGHYRRSKIRNHRNQSAHSSQQDLSGDFSPSRPQSIVSYLIQVSKSTDDYESAVSRLREVRSFIESLHCKIEHYGLSSDNAKAVSSFFQKQVEEAIASGLITALSPHEDAISILSDLAAQELRVKNQDQKPVVGECNDDLVDKMVQRAKEGIPPEKPYFHDDWRSPVEFLYETYRPLLNADTSESSLYQDQLSWIHPSRKKLETITSQADLYGSGAWGEDLMQALRNYYAKRGGSKELAKIVPTKKQRNDKKFRKLGLSDEDIADQQKRSAASFLKI